MYSRDSHTVSDIVIVRTVRSRVIHLKNDRNDLMAQIEQGLHEHHAKLQAQAPSSQAVDASTAALSQSSAQSSTTAFAKVNSVSPGSPAEGAGLKADDSVIKFGSADWLNHEKLAKVAEVVSQNEGVRLATFHNSYSVTDELQRPINVLISRNDPATGATNTVRLSLTPRRGWGGRGLLGCHLVPI